VYTHLRQIPDGIKGFMDGISIAAVIGTLAQLLPAIAALVTIIWTSIRIYETRTVQKLLGRKPDTTTDE